ncbi:VOC family protein [Crossiella cryophila]|uniref:Putative enzyme related to lactoylglutathione lyase n=1 Tax=Crossiella cryophila TaxID=43355 RepID=A0A7W7CJ67_9PSEU|nr:VOC family protein [Crossiella cryophila]MBB4682198.1 putative enzyme related to lactoylglutathione lyase [Crossiella cryophila]
MTLTLGSILLASTNPDRLRTWYRKAFDVTPNQDGFLVFGGVAVLIDQRDDIAATPAEPGRVILNFHLDNARDTAARLDSLGVTWLVELEERHEGMLFATLLDPDGNYLQLIQFSAAYLARTGKGN